jgi:hypothetical protein
MNDSNASEELAAKREENRAQRIAAVKRWVAYIESEPPESWGEQQNNLVNSQLESARQSDLDAGHRQRVERAGRDC